MCTNTDAQTSASGTAFQAANDASPVHKVEHSYVRSGKFDRLQDPEMEWSLKREFARVGDGILKSKTRVTSDTFVTALTENTRKRIRIALLHINGALLSATQTVPNVRAGFEKTVRSLK